MFFCFFSALVELEFKLFNLNLTYTVDLFFDIAHAFHFCQFNKIVLHILYILSLGYLYRFHWIFVPLIVTFSCLFFFCHLKTVCQTHNCFTISMTYSYLDKYFSNKHFIDVILIDKILMKLFNTIHEILSWLTIFFGYLFTFILNNFVSNAKRF